MSRSLRVPPPDAATVSARTAANLGIAFRLGRLAKTCPGFDRADAIAAAFWGLTRAANGFDPSLGFKFSTYAYRSIRSCIHDDRARMAFRPRAIDPDEIAAPEHDDGHPLVPRLMECVAMLDGRRRLAVTLRLGLDGSGPREWTAVGEELGVCPQRAGKLFRLALDEIRKMIEADGKV